MKSAYLAGPMRGIRLLNFPAFFKAAMRLREAGWFIFNPAERDMSEGCDPTNEESVDLSIAFDWDFDKVRQANRLILLPGWQTSVGAKAEIVVAHNLGKQILELSGDYDAGDLVLTLLHLDGAVTVEIGDYTTSHSETLEQELP